MKYLLKLLKMLVMMFREMTGQGEFERFSLQKGISCRKDAYAALLRHKYNDKVSKCC